MKTDSEKEKKLNSALNKLRKLDIQNPSFKTNIEDLNHSTCLVLNQAFFLFHK